MPLLLALALSACGGQSEAESLVGRGDTLHEQGMLDEAIELYTRAIQLDPNLAAAYNNRGLAYDEKGDLGRAIADLDRAIQLDPNAAPTYYNRGLAHKALGKKAEAISDFEKFISLTDNPQLIQQARQLIAELQE